MSAINPSLPPSTRALREELLREQLRAERAKAAIAEIELAVAETKERDRKASPGYVREYPFFGDVSPQSVAECISTITHWARRDPGQPITLLVNTPGGSAEWGLALYETIRRIRDGGTPVVIHVTGRAMSMGAVLLQAGTVRVIDRRAFLMIHEGSVQLGGTAGQVEDAQGYLRMIRSTMLDFLSERPNLSRKQVENRWKRQDWYLDADEALKLGFVDRIV